MTIIPAANYVIGLHPSWPGTIRWELYKLRLQAQGDLVDVPDTLYDLLYCLLDKQQVLAKLRDEISVSNVSVATETSEAV